MGSENFGMGGWWAGMIFGSNKIEGVKNV